MNIYIEKETDTDFAFDENAVIKQVVERAFASEGAPVDAASVNVLITDNEGIRELNRDYRNIDSPTDVLSFPNLDFETPADFNIPDDRKVDYTDPETGELILGDIILNVDRIFSQAEEFGHSIKRETAFLVAHSCLHLCGYDHMTPDEEKVMISKQEEILNSLGITRGD